MTDTYFTNVIFFFIFIEHDRCFCGGFTRVNSFAWILPSMESYMVATITAPILQIEKIGHICHYDLLKQASL